MQGHLSPTYIPNIIRSVTLSASPKRVGTTVTKNSGKMTCKNFGSRQPLKFKMKKKIYFFTKSL